MAIKKTRTLENNFGEQSVITDCYIKVATVSATKDQVNASVLYMKEAGGKVLHVEGFEFPSNLDGPNFIKQAYDHLKTLPKFAGAVDC